MDNHLEFSDVDLHIHLIRGQSVMLDIDLAMIYGVPTKALKRAVRRNQDRFPQDFMFPLTEQEVGNLRCQIGTSSWGGHRYLPFAFTEHGAVMLASVLKSPIAIAASIQIVRAFNRMRRLVAANKEIAKKLLELEDKIGTHDVQIQALFAAIRRFLEPPPEPPRQIGFKP